MMNTEILNDCQYCSLELDGKSESKITQLYVWANALNDTDMKMFTSSCDFKVSKTGNLDRNKLGFIFITLMLPWVIIFFHLPYINKICYLIGKLSLKNLSILQSWVYQLKSYKTCVKTIEKFPFWWEFQWGKNILRQISLL